MKIKTKIVPTLISLFCFILCSYLGLWQLKRLDQKNSKLSKISASLNGTATTISNLSESELYYSKVKLTGRFANTDQNLFVFARQKAGANEQGYLVLTPFQQSNGDYILVSRGIVPDSVRPKVTNPEAEVTITSILLKSEVGKRFDPENIPDKNLWFIITLPQISQYYQKDFGQYYAMQISGETDEHIAPFEAEKLLKIYNPHLGYAITWFALAIAIVVIYTASIHPHIFRKANRE